GLNPAAAASSDAVRSSLRAACNIARRPRCPTALTASSRASSPVTAGGPPPSTNGPAPTHQPGPPKSYAEYLTAAPGEVPGVWMGRQADGLGLSGDVTVEQLEALLCGRDPVTGTPLGRELVDRPTHGTVRSVTSGDLPDSNVWCTAARHRA
ncbi:MAG: relaxase domain-containing protein, partial [Ilumatobacteraceae bacterium]